MPKCGRAWEPSTRVAAAVDAPAAAVGDAADLLHIDVDHVPGPPGLDGAGPAQRFAVDVEVIQAREAELV